MIKKILIAALSAAMVMSMSAFAAEDDVTIVMTDTGEYNEYGLSNAAMDVLTIPMSEATAKYPVSEIIPDGDCTTVIYQNGWTMDYYEDWTTLFTDTDEGGKHLFCYFDVTLPSVNDVAALLTEKGYTVIYEDVDSQALPVKTAAVDPDSQSMMINAGFAEPVYWDIDSEGQGQLTMSYSYNDATGSVESDSSDSIE